MKTLAIVQARSGSTRFPRKVLQELGGTSVARFLVNRLRGSRLVDQIMFAVPNGPVDDILYKHLVEYDCVVSRGSEHDVLDRFYQAALSVFGASETTESGRESRNCVVRITGDCPFVDPTIVDQLIAEFKKGTVDYVSNVAPPTFPDGLDVEVVSWWALSKAWSEATERIDREHVTTFIRGSEEFSKGNIVSSGDFSGSRWTIDEPEDLAVARNIVEQLRGSSFRWNEVLEMERTMPQLFDENRSYIRNSGMTENTGQKLWQRAKRVIPGGNSLLSKRAEMFLPDGWPAYFSKAKGCRVWDLDGRELIDVSILGIGTNILGYGNPRVDDAVRAVVDTGNMSTLNCPEEVYLAERLVVMHPWADMARFARTGGEANAMAIRVARAATGKDGVAVCGYHGWHDWYLAANLSGDQNLKSHLLPGLDPKGVPADLCGTVFPFEYNQFDQLEKLVMNQSIGVIKMEVMRNLEPEDSFLQRVRELSSKHGIALIFDECTSGFRETLGGLHKKYDVEPDMAVFGKTIGNGYAITAVIGRREIMQAAQTTFMSSTFWTERIGPAAALAALDVIEEEKAFDQITQIGRDVTERWKKLAANHGLVIRTSGLPALTGFAFDHVDHLKFKTLLTQEMLAKGYLASTLFYACTKHTPKLIDDYFSALDPVFSLIAECVNGRAVDSLLKGPVCHSGFKRLN